MRRSGTGSVWASPAVDKGPGNGGYLGGAIGIGFMIGPAIGGLLGTASIYTYSHSAVFGIAAVLMICGLFLFAKLR